MEADLALRLLALIAAAKIYVDRLGTSTLCVLDGGTIFLTGYRLLFAERAICHGVVKINLNIKLNGDIDCGDTEAVLPLVATERSWLVLGALVCDGLVAKGALGEHIALAKRVGALPVLGEVEVAVLEVGVTVFDIAPVKTALLFVATLVVCVLRRFERLRRQVPGSGRLLGG
jgi:hypothetical protein